MLLYHYGPGNTKYNTLLTKRLSDKKLSKEEIKEAEDLARLTSRLGPYIDHISFFMDPIPFDIIGDLFKDSNHHVWFNSNTLYEYRVDFLSLEKNIKYEVVETPNDVKILDATNWIDTDDFFYDYMLKKYKRKRNDGEVGKFRLFLEDQVKKYQGTIRDYYLKAVKRKDFKEGNDKKYAANVPHLMLYPSNGEIMYQSSRQITIGYKNDLIAKW
jgi:hypothetical protein